MRPHRLRETAFMLIAGPLLLASGFSPVSAEIHALGGQQAMVVSAHPAASRVGRDVLAEGGNAIDAAIATAFTLAVVEPYSSGLGGGGFAVSLDAASGVVRSLDFREMAPRAAFRDMYLREEKADPDLSETGALSVAVPGLVAGLKELHGQGGHLPWDRLLQPAIQLAREGFPVSIALRWRIEKHASRFNDAAHAIFLPGGKLPDVDQILIQEDLAKTLKAISTGGAERFYRGEVARAIARTVRSGGGLLDERDLLDYRVRWREPVKGSYRGLDVYSMPPPSSGGVHLVQMLNILSHFDLADMGHQSVATIHHMAEAMKFAFADRSVWLGDPDHVDVPMRHLISMAYADSQAAFIQPRRARDWRQFPGVEILPTESTDTTHLSVVDSAGNAVAATLTINLNFGSAWVAEGSGVLLNDEMDDFVSAPGSPNAFGLVGGEANSIAPGKRPLSSMTPTLLLKDGKIFMVTGSPGGSRIITTTLQSILNVVDHGMDVDEALAAPRIHHQWYPPRLYFEPWSLSPDAVAALEGMGHELTSRPYMGNAQSIVVDTASGMRWGASDPRGVGEPRGF